jgi:hypothetical protein
VVHHDKAEELVDQGQIQVEGRIYVAAGGLLMCTCSRENIIIVRCDINRVFHACLLITLLLSLSQLIILGIVAWRAKLVREPSVNTLRRVVHCLALIDE